MLRALSTNSFAGSLATCSAIAIASLNWSQVRCRMAGLRTNLCHGAPIVASRHTRMKQWSCVIGQWLATAICGNFSQVKLCHFLTSASRWVSGAQTNGKFGCVALVFMRSNLGSWGNFQAFARIARLCHLVVVVADHTFNL